MKVSLFNASKQFLAAVAIGSVVGALAIGGDEIYTNANSHEDIATAVNKDLLKIEKEAALAFAVAVISGGVAAGGVRRRHNNQLEAAVTTAAAGGPAPQI